MAQFYKLTVTDIVKTTRDAVAVTLRPVDPEFPAFLHGQYLTFRRKFEDQEVRRSYSLCSQRGAGEIQIGVKKVEDGTFSRWINEDLVVGDTLEALAPMGRFTTKATDEDAAFLCFAAGSGITPILSIIRTVLAEKPRARITLVYANRSPRSIMFREELEELKNLHMGRLNIIHILGRESTAQDLFVGRIDADKLEKLFSTLIHVPSFDQALICGPEPLMQLIAGNLSAAGMDDSQITYELFGTAQPGRVRRASTKPSDHATQQLTQATATLDGQIYSFSLPRDTSLLEGAIRNDVDPPFACRAGVCSTCKAKITDGEVEMVANHALEDYEVERGYVLTCQCFALSRAVAFDFDQ